MTPIETIQQIYAAFGRGDVPTILSQLADDVQWEYGTAPNPVPWLQPLRGRDQVPRFFETLHTQLEFHVFEPRAFMADGRTVVDLIDVEFTVKASGVRVVEHDEVHIWHLDDAGRVARFRHRADTWLQAMALQGTTAGDRRPPPR